MTPHISPEFTRRYVNLADERMGAKVIFATDDFFAPKERLISRTEPVFIPDKYDDHGKWMDGWESRRKRTPGHDWCIVRLGAPGIIRGVEIDTSHFTGNYPPEASLLACVSSADIPPDDTDWTELVAQTGLKGDSQHYFDVLSDTAWTHFRLNIFPDGGVARLRLYGYVKRDWSKSAPGEQVDLAAAENGGRPISCNDQHFGTPANMIAPGSGVNMGDGWETRRRREPGNDWAVLALAQPGHIRRVLVDTKFFKGNYPAACMIEAVNVTDDAALDQPGLDWRELLPKQELSADSEHEFDTALADIGPVSHVRLNIYPDGGISRLRLFGELA